MATAQILSVGATAGSSNSLTEYSGMEGRWPWVSTITDVEMLCASAGTLSHLRVEVNTAPGAGKNFTYTVMVNGVASALTCTIADANTDAEDTTHTVAIVAGDRIALRSVPTGTPTGSGRTRWATQFAHTTASTAIQGTTFDSPNTAATRYAPFGASTAGTGAGSGISWFGTESAQRLDWNIDATITALYIQLSAAPGAGNSWAFTIMKNGSAVAASTVTIADAATSGNVTGLTIDVAPGDLFSLRAVPTSGPASATLTYGVAYTPDVEHQWNVLSNQYDGSEPPNNSFNFLSATEAAWTTTEANHKQLGGAATGSKSYTAKSLRARQDVAPGAGTSRTYTLRLNGADSALAVIINDAETTDTAATDVTIAAGDDINYKHAESGSAANPSVIRIALLVQGAAADVGGGGGGGGGSAGSLLLLGVGT